MYLELQIASLSSVLSQWCGVRYCGSWGGVNKTGKLRGENKVCFMDVIRTSLWKRVFWGLTVIPVVRHVLGICNFDCYNEDLGGENINLE
jgi:hypothetical protein